MIFIQVVTKPAEAIKRPKGKLCQDLANFMESLMKDTSKINEELSLDIQDANHSSHVSFDIVFLFRAE